MAEFEAKITGIADLSKAKQDFDSFKKSMEQPIKITVDASGFNAVWGNIQKQAQQSGIQIGNSLAQGVQKTIRSGSNKVSANVAKAMFDGILPDKKILFNGGGLDAIGTYSDAVKAIKEEFQGIEKSGGFLKNFKFGEDFKSFTAEITNGANATIKVLGELGDILNDKGEVVGHRWNTTNQSYIVDLSSSMKQAQTEAQKLSQELTNVSNAFSSGTFDANISKMEQGLMGISDNVSSDLVKKASDAAAEYYRITQEISNSLANPNQQGVLQGQQLADAYKQAEASLKTYNNAMTEVRANTQKMLAEGVGARNANQVETWAKNNSKALKQYGDQLTDLANKMRNAQTQGELNGYVNQFKNLKAEITAAGLGGRSFGDQLKNAFVHIGEFTGIYAITSQIRQLPREMAQEVIKIDTAMTELRKVSTASASEISNYFDRATDSAYKYGQAINEVIDSTASWTRLGYNLEDSEKLTNASIALARVGSGMDVESSTSAIQSTIKGFGMAADEAQRVADIVNFIADSEPIDAKGIGEGLTRMSSAMAMAGNTLEESIGLLTASTSVTQDPAKSANDWRTISMRIRGAKTELEAMGEDTTGMVTSVSKIREEFKALSGVDIMQDENTFKSTTQIVLELADAWEHMTDIQRAALGELAGGKRGAQSLFAAVQNADIIRKTIADANGDAVGSVDRQMAVWESSVDASLQRFHVAFQELSTDLINSDFLKGIIDAGTDIIHIIDELVKHIGVLGTALTGLGIAKIFTTAVNGAKSVEVASDGVELLATALEAAQGSGAGLTGTIKGLSGVLGTLGAKAGGAGSALGAMFSGLGGFLTSPVGLITAGVAAVAGITALAINARKKQQEELRKQATATTEKWGDDKSSVDDFKRQYTELNDQLKNVNLTESERIGIKQQLLDLQNQISAKYGADIAQLDLINGGYETQLGLITQITEKEAKRNIRDNSEAYQQSVDEMTKQRTFSVRSGALFGGMYQRSLSPELQESFDKIYADANFIKDGEMFKFTGNTSEFDKAVNDVLDGLETLKESASEADAEILQTAIDSATKASKKNAETLNKYQDNYKSYLQQSLYADGFGDELAEYAKRTQEYNEALLTGDFEKINAAKKELDAYKVTVQEITDAHSEYGDFFDEVANSVDKTTEKFYQFKDIIQDGVAQSTNDLGKYQDQISAAAKKIKSLGLDSVDVENILLNGGVGFGDLSELAKLYNPDFDFSNEAVSAFADLLAQLGLVAGDASEGMDLAKSSFEDFLKVASASIETVEKTNAALINSFGNKGLSMGIDAETGAITGDVATILNAYKDLKGFDAKVLFERTADGINVNTEALRALQSEQENTVKAEFMRRIIEAQNEISKAGTAEGKKYWEDQLETVRLLSTAYDGATSAYQKWIDAQKMTSPGSKYDTIVNSALKQGKEYYDKGLVGNPAFQAIAQLFTNEDLSLATNEEITKAYEDGVDTVKKYFTEGAEGAEAFADKLVDLKLATKEWNSEKDTYDYDFSESGINTTKLADELGISVDLVEAAFGKLQERGFTINFINDDQLTRLTELDEKASNARDRLAELADEEGRIGNTDVSSVIDIDITGLDTVDECNEAIEQISEAKANAEVDSDEYQYLDTLLQDIIMMRDVLEEGTKPSVDDSELVSVQETYDSLVDRILLLNHMNAAPGVHFDIDNDEEVRELAETLIGMDDEEYKAKLGIDGIDTVDGIIEKLKQEHITVPVTTDTSGAQVNTSGTVDYSTGSVEAVGAQTAVLNYTTGTIEPIQPQTTTINYTTGKIEQVPDQSASINYSNGTIEQVPDQYATINYSANVTGLSALPDDGERRTIYLDTYTVEHYKGTVSRSAFQSLGSAGKVTGGSSHASGTLGKVGLKNDESALINELGAEIVVRPSDDSWMIFNDGKPTFANLKRGDVIFNADLTRQLLEKGEADDYARILSGNSHASGTLKGKAHATVKGGGSFKKATSSSKKSGGGGGSDGGSSNSKDDAKDFNEVLDEIQINIDRIERDIKNLDTIASDTFTNLTGRTSALNKELVKVRKEIKVQQTGYSRYLAKANSVGLNGTWAARVRAGENLTIDDVKDEDLWDKIQEYQKWYELALDCRDAIYQLKVNEAELWQQRFDVRQTDFENQIEQIQHAYEMLDSFIEKAENTGRITSNTLRLRQLDQERSKVARLQDEYKALEGVIAEALRSGEITQNSEGYYNMLNTLNEIRQNIAESTSNIEKLNKEIRETEWEIFDRALEKIENINDELEFLYGILGDEEQFYGEGGRVTNEGISAFGILSAQYNVAMQEAQKYADEIRKINQDIANDPYNQDLIERQEELRKSQRDAIEDAEKYKDSIVDLVKSGIKAQIDAIKELIDQYTDLLDAEKDEHDYAKKVSSAQENINKLQKQLNAYGNDNSEEGMARRQKLVNDLRNAQDSLAETEEDRRISQTKKLLSDLQEEYEDILNARLDNIDGLIQAVVDGVDANSSIIKEAITTAAQDVGYMLSENTSIIFDNASDSKNLASYFTNGDFVEKVTSIADAVKNIDNYIQNAIKNADQTQGNNISKEDSATSSTESIMNGAAQVGTRVRNNTNKISGLDGNWSKNGKNWEWTFNDGEKATGWSLIDNKWYSFENNGRMRANEWFQDSNGKFYHLGASGAMDRSKWITKGNSWSYVGSNGAASTGWQYLKWSGGNDWFYFNDKGDMLTGLQNIGGRNYYMDTRTGAMAKNKWVNSGGKWYYMDKTGAASTGWRQLDWSGGKNWFYFNGNGEMLTGMQNVGGNMYYMDGKTGAMAKNKWIKSNGKWYYMGESGAAAKGWNYLKSGSGQNWYYFNPDGTMKASEWYYDPKYGAWYWFTESGAMARDGKFKTIDGEKWFDASGKWRGYKSGTKAVGADGLYWTNEGMPETIIRKSDGAILTRLNSGDTVFNGDATKTMWDFANNPAKFLRGMGVSNTYGSGNNVNLEFNLSGLRSPTEFMNALRKDKRFEQFIQEITIGRVNGHGALAKNAIKF